MIKKVVALSNVFDENYETLRGESVARCLSTQKRKNLFRCLEMASERELIVLSSPPKAQKRNSPKWLPAVVTKFSIHQQFFCENWDVPKLRILLSWFFYAKLVLHKTQDGDVLIIDNYEFIYVISALITKLLRRVTIILDYEDGKHLIDHGWQRLLSGLAEFIGRPLVRGALLAHPCLASRLSDSIPIEVVPGFVVPVERSINLSTLDSIRFLYSGSLDHVRGVDLLIQALDLLPERGWHLDVSGFGPYAFDINQLATSKKYCNRVTFHGSLDLINYECLISKCHVGLNLQRAGDPISDVTFPSKIFSYLSAGLVVLSSLAGNVPKICDESLIYFRMETPESLAIAMSAIIKNPINEFKKIDTLGVSHNYSLAQTAQRLRKFFFNSKN